MRCVTGALLATMLSASPSFAIDTCLIGLWQVDAGSLADAMGAQMGGTASHEGGGATLEISEDGAMRMAVDNLAINTQLPNAPAVAVTINGRSQATMNTDAGGNYTADVTDYALVGSADVMGKRMDVPISSADGGGWGQSNGTYTCDDATLTFMATTPGSIPPSWARVR